MWDVPEKDSCLEVGKEVGRGTDNEAYQDNESHDFNWFIEKDDGSGLQRPGRLNVDPEVVNDNALSLETVNRCDDDFIFDDFEVENETLHDYSNEQELSSDNESEND